MLCVWVGLGEKIYEIENGKNAALNWPYSILMHRLSNMMRQDMHDMQGLNIQIQLFWSRGWIDVVWYNWLVW